MSHAFQSAHKRVNPALELKLQGWRARLLIILLLAGFATLAVRAFYLQGLNTEFLQAKGEAADKPKKKTMGGRCWPQRCTLRSVQMPRGSRRIRSNTRPWNRAFAGSKTRRR